MFNSSLIGISIELNDGKYYYDQPLVKACREFHLDIVRMELEMWKDQGGSDEDFIERFSDDFPPGFLRRDLQRAKNILYDLYDIAISDILRFQLAPIYTYVMYRLIEDWFTVWDDYNETIIVPRGLKTYLRKMHASKYHFETVVSWFTDGEYCANDFAETYNGDYVSIDFAEEIAGMYLDDEDGDIKLEMIGVTIKEYLICYPMILGLAALKNTKTSCDSQKRAGLRQRKIIYTLLSLYCIHGIMRYIKNGSRNCPTSLWIMEFKLYLIKKT